MQMITVSRNDEIYEAFADVAQAVDGTLVCTYRESMGHSSRPFSRIIVRRSFDRGLTWSPRQVVVERTEEETTQGLGRLNCSRIVACRDGTLLLVVDLLLKDTFEEYLDRGICMNLLLRSHDNGATWEGPEETGMTEGHRPLHQGTVQRRSDCRPHRTVARPAGDRGFYRSADKLPVHRPRPDLGRPLQGARPRRIVLHRTTLAAE